MSCLHVSNSWKEDSKTTESFKIDVYINSWFCINYIVLLYSEPNYNKTFCISNIFVPMPSLKGTKKRL